MISIDDTSNKLSFSICKKKKRGCQGDGGQNTLDTTYRKFGISKHRIFYVSIYRIFYVSIYRNFDNSIYRNFDNSIYRKFDISIYCIETFDDTILSNIK